MALIEPTDLSERERLLWGGGEMGQLMREYDWSTTPVGAVEDWPQSLRTAVSILLASGYPMLVVWGPSFVQFYNDAYRPVLGAKHPAALGQTTPECWSEIWETMLGPMFRQVVDSGIEISAKDLMFPLERHGFTEECYFDFSYSPIRDESYSVGGILVTCSETTGRVVGERRLKALRELADAGARATTALEACEDAAAVLRQNDADVPFALIYLLGEDGTTATLAASAGLEADASGAPTAIDLRDGARNSAWPIRQVVASGAPLLIEELPSDFGTLPGGPWPEPARRALLLPIAPVGQDRPKGVLVAGLSPRLAVDAEYRSFIGLVAGQIATAVTSARAHEEERRRAEALAELDRAKTAFFSNVSHEFRTPLSLLLGPLDDALSNTTTPLPHPHRDGLEMARRNGLRLLRLVNALLDFSRIEAGRVDAVYEPTDLASATRELASSFRSAVERAGLRFVVECDELAEPVFVDRQMWEKVVLNLLSNAFKFTLTGEIGVSVRRVGDVAELVIRDTGVGIPEHELPRLFERFHRVQGARARTQEGTGIGLELVHELVRLHGGTIAVASTPDVGTTATVRLPFGSAHLPADRVGTRRTLESTSTGAEPYVEEALRWIPDAQDGITETAVVSSEADVAQPDSTPVTGARILIAEDNADMREYLCHLLGAAHSVECVADGTTALHRAIADPPDLVLTDVMMPGLDGFQLLNALRTDEATRLIPVILLSARAGEEAKVEGLDVGADDYLVKPFTPRELSARVRANLELSRLRRDAVRLERAARQQAESERERLRQLFEQAPAVMCILTGPDHIFTLANGRYIQAIGNRPILGQPVREALPELEGQGFLELLDAVYATGEPVVGREARAMLARGPAGALEEAFFDYIYAPVRDGVGNVEGVFVHGFEVTELVHARQRFEATAADNARLYLKAQRASHELDQQRRAFMSTAAHDLRTPIAAIRATAQLARRKLQRDGGATDADQLLGRIESSTEKMTTLIDELLDITQSESAGGLVLSRSAVDLYGLAQRVLDEHRSLTNDHGLKLVQPTQEVVGHWDPTRLERAIGNLISNAIKYSPNGGDIVVAIGREYVDGHSLATLTVSDSGVGIRPDELDRVFHRFERGSNVGSIPGNGIGLAYAKDIAVQHGGTISVVSEPDRGTTFVLRLPLSSL